ncbi:uncharacterized protein LOC112637793 [Camponotus floridanus]|uniref:uncharacterized protein LOC112637793 n=1 Tax=Camponotus floridanus TaxID=104421 RepID=UPI000DC67093|nr:uncharacterized protein LOC112637793 [Camponotus floridanus]
MRYTAELGAFMDYTKCRKDDDFLKSLNAPQFSTSLALEPNTSSTIRLQSDASSLIYKKKKDTIRAIMNCLSESKWFIRAAEEVINKKEKVATVVQKYGFNSPEDRDALDKRIDIYHTMSNIRKDIIYHLELSNRVKEAVTEFFEENKQKDDIVQKHFSSAEDSQILCNYQKLLQECRIGAIIGIGLYEYDDIISYKDVFTFKEELSLLSFLKIWETNCTCSCRYCALEHLLSLAYITAYTKNKTYPSTWNVHKQADKQWLYNFEMRHSKEISVYLFCTKYRKSASSASQSPSFNVTILEPNTLSIYQTFEKIKLENDMQKIVKIYERFDIRQRITNFLNLSERLMSAAEEVLIIQKNLENVVKTYEITSEEEHRILISIIFILEQNNQYLEEKKEYENAVPRLLTFDGSVENAAKNYNINHKLLENEIENHKLPRKPYVDK